MLNKLLKSQAMSLASMPIRSHRVAHRRNILNAAFEKERKERNKEIRELRKKHKRDYWETQTQVENHYLTNVFKVERIRKQ